MLQGLFVYLPLNYAIQQYEGEIQIQKIPIIKELQSQGITSYKSLANALNVRGIPTANKRQWHGTTVKNIIKRSM